ncbi:MAG TPA: PoNe immunity protein domain-containing protein, partial [Bacteroidia bacterium]|nr:PoNe immunity protein domain-containing protein [Bacteroidia bacterium]
MRSTIKDRDFYCKRIEATRKLQEKIELRLSSGEVQLDRQLAVKEMLFSQYLHLAILEYSSGMELELISVDYNKALHLLSTAWPLKSPEEVEIPDYLKDWYVKFIWIIVFGDALQIPATDREMVIATWRKGGYRDWLIEYLLSPWGNIDAAVSN